jgi:hypothetical protein
LSKQVLQKAVLSKPIPTCNIPKHSLHSYSAKLPQTVHCRGAENRLIIKKESKEQSSSYSQSSIISVTSSTCDGKILGYILKLFPNLGIWMIKQDGTSFNFIFEVKKLCSNNC